MPSCLSFTGLLRQFVYLIFSAPMPPEALRILLKESRWSIRCVSDRRFPEKCREQAYSNLQLSSFLSASTIRAGFFFLVGRPSAFMRAAARDLRCARLDFSLASTPAALSGLLCSPSRATTLAALVRSFLTGVALADSCSGLGCAAIELRLHVVSHVHCYTEAVKMLLATYVETMAALMKF